MEMISWEVKCDQSKHVKVETMEGENEDEKVFEAFHVTHRLKTESRV